METVEPTWGFLVNCMNGESFPLSKAAVFVGRGDSCDLVLHDAFISREHAMLIRVGNKVMLQDMESSNGTKLNSARVSVPSEINDGDEITLGIHRLVFVSSTASDQTIPVRQAAPVAKRPFGVDTQQLPSEAAGQPLPSLQIDRAKPTVRPSDKTAQVSLDILKVFRKS